MSRFGRVSAWLRPGWLLSGALAGIFAAWVVQAGPLGKDLAVADPVAALSAPQRAAARALGEARRAVDAGQVEQARAELAKVSGVPGLEGYAELVRVRLLMKEGSHQAAHRLASQAIDESKNDALRAALGVLQGEALALAGDGKGAELAWNELLGGSQAEDEAVRNSIQLAIVESRQRTGSLDPKIDPRVLLDQAFEDVTLSTGELPSGELPAAIVLEKADAALAAGRSSRAVDLYDEAIAGELAAEDRLRAQLQRGHALFRSRRYERDAAQFAALLPDLEARFWGARSRARLGDVDGALVEFEHVTTGEDEELASWAFYLMGTLFEDRGEVALAIRAYRSAARYERFPDRARSALWREGWVQYRSGGHSEARTTFRSLASRLPDPLDRLRPRYWAARAAIQSDDPEKSREGQQELEVLARDFPLSYYGWRAAERLTLGGAGAAVAERELAEGTRRVDDVAIERAAMLIEGGLDDLARGELRFAAGRARGFVDRTQVGMLLTRVGDYHRANQLVVTAYADSLARGLQPGREVLWWLAWPPAYRDVLYEVLPVDAGIDPELVWAIMREESHYQVDARSAVGALGLLQLMPATAAQLAEQSGLESFEPADLFDPKTNISLGVSYLVQLGIRFDGRMSAAVGSYNAGPNKVASWLRGDAAQLEDDVWVENIPYDQTRAYVKRVLRSLHVYKSFYR